MNGLQSMYSDKTNRVVNFYHSYNHIETTKRNKLEWSVFPFEEHVLIGLDGFFCILNYSNMSKSWHDPWIYIHVIYEICYILKIGLV